MAEAQVSTIPTSAVLSSDEANRIGSQASPDEAMIQHPQHLPSASACAVDSSSLASIKRDGTTLSADKQRKRATAQKNDESAALAPASRSKEEKAAKNLSASAEEKKQSYPSKPYVELAHEAIAALNDRTGSSAIAISKWIQSTYPEMLDVNGNSKNSCSLAQFRSRLNTAIKSGVKSQRFSQVRASYKISSDWKVKEKARQQRKQQSTKAASDKATVPSKQKATNSKENADTTNDRGPKLKRSRSPKSNSQSNHVGKGGKSAARKPSSGKNTKVSKPGKQKGADGQEDKTGSASKVISADDEGSALVTLKARNARRLAEIEGKMSAEAFQKEKEKLAAREEEVRIKEERVREKRDKARDRADRLRKRRYPMEDTKLHAEDKEFGLKPPDDVLARPYLPYFWQTTRPIEDPARRGKTSANVLTGSKVDNLDVGSRGLVPDLLQVYHFFRGDVRFTGEGRHEDALVPLFTLQNLIFATEQITTGQSKASRMIPPLIAHLFCTSLFILCDAPARGLSGSELHLRRDLHKYLKPALTPVSWPDILVLYIDAMERYYTSDVSSNSNVLPSLNIDIRYLLHTSDDAVVPMTPFAPPLQNQVATPNADDNDDDDNGASARLPDGYTGYLGDSRSALSRGYWKLQKQEVWTLSAEEIMALLRALTDDILATHPAVGSDIAKRDEQMQELLRAKRAADSKLRKVRLAFEGPKRQRKREDGKRADEGSGKAENDKGENGKTGAANSNQNDGKRDEPFKPTASKNQFEAAKKAQQKASDAYEKGIKMLVARTEPVGYDRNFNAVYCFRHHPEVLYVEELRSPSTVASDLPDAVQIRRRSWHVIETSSLFDMFTDSLDIRGRRENDLYNDLMGPQGSQQSLRKYLCDDVKERQQTRAEAKQKEALQSRLEIARRKCNEEEGRRSGRLAGQAEEELGAIQQELEELEQRLPGGDDVRDYEDLTGLTILRQFDSKGQLDTRRTRGKKASSKATTSVSFNCSKLVRTGTTDNSGIVAMLTSKLLELEKRCEDLASWDRDGVDRSQWIGRLENAAAQWSYVPVQLGSPVKVASAAKKPPSLIQGDSVSSDSATKRESVASAASMASNKKRKMDPSSPSHVSSSSGPGQPPVSSIVSMLKMPLLQLEERVADMANILSAARDTEVADDNISVIGGDDDVAVAEKKRMDKAWKKLVHQIRAMPSKRYVQIREKLVGAIAAARSAHIPEVVSALRAALLLHHPNAAGEARKAAIAVLVSHGDYSPDDEDDSDSEDDVDAKDAKEHDEYPSVLAAEATALASSLAGSDESERDEWIASVNSCRTIARLGALAAGFLHQANATLRKIEDEREALTEAIAAWQKGPKKLQNFHDPSEVWANVNYTDEIVMAKCERYPWWPAKVCSPKEPNLSQSLTKLGRTLVALVGEMGGLRVVKNENIKPFDSDSAGVAIEDEDENDNDAKGSSGKASNEMRKQLQDCIAMARRIKRGRGK